jgi:hypothetical protein
MRSLVFLSALALTACAGGAQVNMAGPLPNFGAKSKPAEPSPEEDPKAPGQIPRECEALLNKSREWGFVPERAWRPANAAQAVEAAEFFAGFHLVPEATSNFARAWLKESEPKSPAAARKSLDRMDRAQSCDFLLAHKLLLALLDYRWPKADREKASHAFLSFVVNQQGRVSPSVARAVQIDVLGKAVKKGFVKADAREVRDLRKWFDEKTVQGVAKAETVDDAIGQWRLSHEELAVSEDARDRLSRLLPLP